MTVENYTNSLAEETQPIGELDEVQSNSDHVEKINAAIGGIADQIAEVNPQTEL